MRGFSGNNQMKVSSAQNPEIVCADSHCREAELGVQNVMQELGQRYYDANKDNANAEYYDLIDRIKQCVENANLWRQYRLSLEGQVKCEQCGTIITSDSLFCKQCGSSVQGLDFSGLGVGTATRADTTDKAVCQRCGNLLVSGAAFCEVCGSKV